MTSKTSYSKTTMTSAGRVPGARAFGHARVIGVTGGDSPRVHIHHANGPGPGAPIASMDATEGAEIDALASPVPCPNGVYLAITGDPRRISVEVLVK